MSLLGGLGINLGGMGGALGLLAKVITGLIIFLILGGIGLFVFVRKKENAKYNIPIVIVTPRSDGRVVEINNAVGGFFKSSAIGGVTSFRVKREGIGIVDIPPPTSDFLTGATRTLLLAQKGMDDYEPIKPESLNTVTTPSGEVMTILQLKAINQDATAWVHDNQSNAKRRFTFEAFWDKWQTPIAISIFVFIVLLACYIQWMGLKDVVVGLENVASAMRTQAIPIISSG